MPKLDTTGGGVWPLRRAENAVARLAATSRRVEFTTPGLVFSTPGLVDPVPRPVSSKIGARKKEGTFGRGFLPFYISKVALFPRNAKSAFSILTFRRSSAAPRRSGAADGRKTRGGRETKAEGQFRNRAAGSPWCGGRWSTGGHRAAGHSHK